MIYMYDCHTFVQFYVVTEKWSLVYYTSHFFAEWIIVWRIINNLEVFWPKNISHLPGILAALYSDNQKCLQRGGAYKYKNTFYYIITGFFIWPTNAFRQAKYGLNFFSVRYCFSPTGAFFQLIQYTGFIFVSIPPLSTDRVRWWFSVVIFIASGSLRLCWCDV